MFHKLTSLFIFFCCLYRYSLCDCFYIFDVGQGNCQLAVFEDEDEKTKIGILYDCGSSSTREHVKISALKQNVSNVDQDSYHYIFKKLLVQNPTTNNQTKGNINFNGEKVRKDKNAIKNDQTNEDKLSPNARKRAMSRGFLNKKEKKDFGEETSVRKKTIGKCVKDVIDSYGLKYLFVIFSHPDADHINCINEKTLTDTLPFGVWYGGGDWNKHVTKCAKAVQKTLNNDTYSLLKNLSNDKIPNGDGNWCFNLAECVQKENFTDREIKILKDIEVAQISSGNINSQSAIVKIKMTKLGMQFFLTGDAEGGTFEQIKEGVPKFFQKAEDCVSLVMLPHHGSEENTSVDELFKHFQPDIIGISAGSGNKYNHPSEGLIEDIINREYKGSFWEKFEIQDTSESMIAYRDKSKDGAFVFYNECDKMPFVCTNLLGDIKIDEGGIKAKFSNIVEEGGIKYRVDFSKRVDVKNVNFLNPKPHTAGSIQEASDGEYKYYFCVPERKNGENKKMNGKNKKRDIETESLYYRAFYANENTYRFRL